MKEKGELRKTYFSWSQGRKEKEKEKKKPGCDSQCPEKVPGGRQIFFLSLFAVLGIEPRVWSMPGKHFTT
jgi:hypothetical protein